MLVASSARGVCFLSGSTDSCSRCSLDIRVFASCMDIIDYCISSGETPLISKNHLLSYFVQEDRKYWTTLERGDGRFLAAILFFFQSN